jgi:hypothetical protein
MSARRQHRDQQAEADFPFAARHHGQSTQANDDPAVRGIQNTRKCGFCSGRLEWTGRFDVAITNLPQRPGGSQRTRPTTMAGFARRALR